MGNGPTWRPAGDAADAPVLDMGNSPTCGPQGDAADAPAPGVGNGPTLRAAGHRSRRAGVRCGKQPYLAGRRAPQRARRRQMWETALLSGPPGAAAGTPAPDVGNSPTWRPAGDAADAPVLDMGNSPTCGPQGDAADAPAPGVGNGPTLRAAGHRSRRAGVRCGKQPYLAGRRAPQRARRRQMWETALLSGPPGAAAGTPAPDVGNSPTLRAAGHRSQRAGARCRKQPYFLSRA